MAFQSLLEIDATFTQQPAARIVSELPFQSGGVDPLGLRQINLDLMDWALPGINNVTTLVRPYVLMTWAWWKAAQIARTRNGKEVLFDALLGVVDRIETIFIWSHILAGKNEKLPGKNILSRALPALSDTKAYSFNGKAWEKLRKDRRPNTSLMSAVQYGPSIRTLEGLGWLSPIENGALVPVDDVMDAVNAFDALVAPHLPRTLTGFDGGALTSKSAAKLYPLWRAANPTRNEQKIFRQIFFNRGKTAQASSREFRRYATLKLMLTVVGAINSPVDAVAIRRMMYSGRKLNKGLIQIPAELVETQRGWVALQARQLQRLGLESLLVWVEKRIEDLGGTASSPQLSADANRLATEESSNANSKSVRTFRSAIAALGVPYGWPAAAGAGGKADIFKLMDKIVLAQQEENYNQIPGLALTAIVIASVIADALLNLGEYGGLDGLLGGEADRLPLELVSRRLTAIANEPMQVLWNEIIEGWVLGQHVRWSVARSGDETQRLRVAVDEGGWVRLRPKLSGPFKPTSDRLATALALAANCGLLRPTNDDEPLYVLA